MHQRKPLRLINTGTISGGAALSSCRVPLGMSIKRHCSHHTASFLPPSLPRLSHSLQPTAARPTYTDNTRVATQQQERQHGSHQGGVGPEKAGETRGCRGFGYAPCPLPPHPPSLPPSLPSLPALRPSTFFPRTTHAYPQVQMAAVAVRRAGPSTFDKVM